MLAAAVPLTTLFPPSQSASVTPRATLSASISASTTHTSSLTPSATGTSTHSLTATATESRAPSTSPSFSVTPSATSSQTPTASLSATATWTRSVTPSITPSTTPPPTPSVSPMCRAPVRNITTLVGVSGASPVVNFGSWGNVGMYTSGSCGRGLSTLFGGPRGVFLLSLGGPALVLGGTLTLSTCGLTSDDTVLYVGTGCPTWALSFGCLRGNDNAGDEGGVPCSGNAGASTLILTGVASRVVFVQLGGYLGAAVTSGLSWRYLPPGVSPSPNSSTARSATRTSTRTRSVTATRTRSATRSKSRSRKAKRAAV